MKKQTTYAALLTFGFSLLLGAFASSAFAHKGEHRQGEWKKLSAEERAAKKQEYRQKRETFLKEKVGLSDETIAKMRAIHKAKRPDIKQAKTLMRDARKQLRRLKKSGSATEAQMIAAREDLKQARTEMKAIKKEMRSEIAAVLTPEELTRLKEARREFRKEHKRHHRGKRGKMKRDA